jgi:UDP-N-acetyl-D-mannosaminuronic acid transferase (WecB/TagA/CpsF family)
MYHIGKVLEVWSGKETKGDESVQATLEMWDENVITLRADAKISKQLKQSDFVLVDYTPVMVGASATPRQLIVKILGTKAGERAWQVYKDFHKKQKVAKVNAAMQMPAHQAPESYFG